METTSSRPAILFSSLVPILGVILAVGIFFIDTVTTLDIAIAVLYVVVVLMAANMFRRRGVIVVAVGCLAATVLSYLISHGMSADTALVRCLVSLAAISITTVLALQNQAARLALTEQARLLDLTHDTIFARNVDDVVTYWNKGAEQLYGWPKEETLGKVVHNLLRTEFPAPLEQLRAELLRTGRWEGELIHTKRDGTKVIVASRWSLRRDELGRPLSILEINNDVTERKRAEDALRRSEAYLAEAQRLSHTGSFGWNVSTGEIFWSEESYRILGYDRSIKPSLELVRRRVHPEDGGIVEEILNRVRHDFADWKVEHRLLMPDATVKYLEVVARCVRTGSGETEYVGALMDVTAVKSSEFALSQTLATLAHVNRVTTLETLTASIAHEVNQPLAAMVTNASAGLRWLSAQSPDLNEVRQTLERVVKDGNRAGEVIGRIRALVQRTPAQNEWLDINEAIQEAIALTRSEIQRKGIALRLRLGENLPRLRGDRVQLQQVSLNLMVNAIESMSALVERVRELEVESAIYESRSIIFSVRDSGVGLDMEKLDLIFDAFYSTKSNGTGMGLAICRKIVESHGGRLWATPNSSGIGATFHVTLPIDREASP